MRHLRTVLATVERQVSAEIATTAAPTTGLLDGTARQRRDLRVLARRLNGVDVKYGVTLEQAIKQSKTTARPVVVKLETVGTAVEPVAVEPPVAITLAESAPVTVAKSLAVESATVLHTVRGHHFALNDPRNEVNDHVCRGCGTSGHFGYILDRTPCAAPYFGTESLGQVA